MRLYDPTVSTVEGPRRERYVGRQRFIIFVRDDLADEVRRLAREGKRPLNSEFELILEQWLRQEAVAA